MSEPAASKSKFEDSIVDFQELVWLEIGHSQQFLRKLTLRNR